ncbi:MAG: phosphoribosyltransferase family protein [Bacteroidota bacterium]|nr:phosphoribosyltransferase family protein [Bacteroidota bacterium]
MIATIKDLLFSVFSLIFPNKCILCGKVIGEEEIICSKCKELYPIVHLHKDEFFVPLMPYVEDIFILSHYRYTAKAIQLFKFQRQINKGVKLAKLLSKQIQQLEWAKELDFVIPVPLHKKAQHKRQFNQCEIIAKEVYKELKKNNPNLELSINNLYRINNNKPQHTLNAQARYENVRDNFDLRNVAEFRNKKVLIIDDVITTCSTLKACCVALKKTENITIYATSVATSRINM